MMARVDDVEQRMRAAREAGGTRARAADAVRALIDDLVTADLTDAEADSITEAISAVRSAFGGVVRRVSWAAAMTSPEPGSFDFALTSPLMGGVNPIAPPLALRLEGDRVIGEVTFGAAYEGPPGHVHGGVTAAAFDEVLGMVQATGERPGMTGRLTISYRSPTPLGTLVRFVGWVERIEGRKIFTAGYSEVDGPDGPRRCADAEGLFVAVDFERLRSAWGGGGA
jgi:acyl-coenzyme A thioesterase PaaI-like protein